jgi:hydrogenase maturation protease
MQHIVCIGNRLITSDDAGPRVYDRLLAAAIPEDVMVIDGGLAGLDLLGLVEGSERAVFVDQVRGFGPRGAVMKLASRDIEAAGDGRAGFGHASGLPFLLRCLPRACEPPPREVTIVGLEGLEIPDSSVDAAARLCLELVSGTNGAEG